MQFLKRNRWLLLLCLVLLCLFVWWKLWSANTGKLQVSFLDIGQGDSIFIQAPNGRQVLIDGGRDQTVLKRLGEVMPYGDRSIDVMIATHPDADHIGGLPFVLAHYNVAMVMEPGVGSDSDVYQTFEEKVGEEKAAREYARRGMTLLLDQEKNVHLDILFPDQDVSTWETNEASIVAKLVYGHTSFLLTGDAPRQTELYLDKLNKKELDVDVLKLGHHGSHTSTSPTFIQDTTPDYAIISAGKNNSYGHPHPEVLQVLEAFQVPYLATYEQGTITFVSDGEVLIKK
jgi:competence protein ComEC